jgi:hypothetical protein
MGLEEATSQEEVVKVMKSFWYKSLILNVSTSCRISEEDAKAFARVFSQKV